MKKVYIIVLLVLNLIFTGALAINQYLNRNIELDFSDKIIKVSGLVVTDSNGVERVIIGANLPHPQGHGTRFDRGGEVSGIMLYDSEGQERGGYVTDNDYGNIFMTLDSKTSQRALFIAEPQGAATLQVWGNNGNKIVIGASDEGTQFDISENGKEK
ncbi:hypothetical protein [Cellulophaga baltica]|uniref:Uncharacterized protein n=1 Tax=Cellulophaga baltica TaxID=76594 RepID=A0A1G7LU53_9FLAO|nr:hypothetical protein [Cellulophaga baltica]SDF52490.1 hypothetical protein SAMN04487992_12114 [Cellulophaga baltica]